MSSISAKILETLRIFKSDAFPRPPRSESRKKPDDLNGEVPNDENIDNSNEQEEIFLEEEDIKPKTTFFGKHKGSASKSQKDKKRGVGTNNISINTQTMGNVINVIDTNNFRWGNDYVYYIGSQNKDHSKMPDMDMPEEEDIKKTNLITLLMEATIPAEHEYIDFISKNLGKKWRSFFRKLGYTTGRIETFEIDEAVNGVAEARYKLLLDWARNDEDGTLGCLAKLLWQEGERQIVKELSLIYEKNCQ